MKNVAEMLAYALTRADVNVKKASDGRSATSALINFTGKYAAFRPDPECGRCSRKRCFDKELIVFITFV